MYRKLLDNIAEGIYFVDVNRTITYWNKGAEKISGYNAKEVTGSSCSNNILVHVDADGTPLCIGECPILDTISNNREHEADVFLHHRDGHRVPVHVHATPLLDDNGKCIGAIEIFRDNTSHIHDRLIIENLKREALLDHLTGLPNRRFLDMKLTAAFDERKRYGMPFGIFFTDIDRFKSINDTYGHDTGDEVLSMVANTIKSNIRSSDIAGRWGGEEFLGIAQHSDENSLFALAEKLRILVENSFLFKDDRKITATITIGVTMSRDDDTEDSLIERADRLLYKGKECGRNCVQVA